MKSLKSLKNKYSYQIYLFIITITALTAAYFLAVAGLNRITGFALLVDKTASDFSNGIYVNTSYNITGGYIQLVPNNLTGTYTSSVKDAGTVSQWDYINWTAGKTAPINIVLQNPATGVIWDSYVSMANPATNHGTLDPLLVRDASTNAYRAYAMFNLSSIPAGAIIESAKICFYASRVIANTNVSAYHVLNNSWAGQNETTINWNNQVCGTGFNNSAYCNLTSYGTNYVTSKQYYCWNVTQAVINELNDNDYNVSFALKTSETNNLGVVELSSKEASSNRPIINITYRFVTNLTFQARSDDDNLSWGPFLGPDGTTSSYYTSPYQLNLSNNSYFQYKAYFYSNSSSFSPYLYNVSITYTPENVSPIIIDIISPENITYTTAMHGLEVDFNKIIDEAWYSLNDGANQTLCSNSQHCDALITGVEGSNKLTVWANDTYNYVNSSTVWFNINTGLSALMSLKQSTGTEYEPGDNVIISGLLSDDRNNLVSGALVTYRIRYPNATTYVLLTAYEISPGYYKANVTLGNDIPEGTYQVEGTGYDSVRDYIAYSDSVFQVKKPLVINISNSSLTVNSGGDYDYGDSAIITASVKNNLNELVNAQWINITITHRPTGTVFVNNTPMNYSGETGFYYYSWNIPGSAECGGYEVRVKANINGLITGYSTVFNVACWINKQLLVNTTTPAHSTIIGFNSLFNLTSYLSAVNSDLQDCRAGLYFSPGIGLTLPNNDQLKWINDLLVDNPAKNVNWVINGTVPGSYNLTVQGSCSYQVSDSSSIINLTVHEETPISLSKYFSPDLVIADNAEPIEVNITMKNVDDDDGINSLRMIDEIPYDFTPPNPSSVEVWFVNDTNELLLNSYYTINISNIDEDNNLELVLDMTDISLDVGHELGPNDSIRVSYLMNSSAMSEGEERETLTNAEAVDTFQGISSRVSSIIIKSRNVLVRADKLITSNDVLDPANITDLITIKGLGGNVNNLSFADYLPQGTNLVNASIVYCNHTTHACTQLVNGTDYIITGPFNDTLPDSLPAHVYSYNLSIDSPVNWGGVLYKDDNITFSAQAVIVGGGTWALPANIFAFDPTYQKHIMTETHADYSVPLFDILLTMLSSLVRPGEPVSAIITLINVGGPKALADVFMTYSIKTMAGVLVTEKSETLAVISEKERNISISLPLDISSGRYTYEALATYTGREAMATDVFEVTGGSQSSAITIDRNDIIYFSVLVFIGLGIALFVKRLLPEKPRRRQRRKR